MKAVADSAFHHAKDLWNDTGVLSQICEMSDKDFDIFMVGLADNFKRERIPYQYLQRKKREFKEVLEELLYKHNIAREYAQDLMKILENEGLWG